MMWTWMVAGLDDPDLAGDLAEGFETQEEAEAWMKANFADLLDEGVEEATLTDDDTEVYSMPLTE